MSALPTQGAAVNTPNNNLSVNFKRTDPRAIAPKYATAGAGCFDLFSPVDGDVGPLGALTVDIGVAFEFPLGYTLLVFSRSGHGAKHGIRLANGTGVIDSDYRGSVKVALASHNRYDIFRFSAGDRIAQAMLVPTPTIELIEVDELSETQRGAGGFGSTGA